MDDVTVIGKEALRSAHTSAPELHGEVLGGPERRRRWSTEEKLRVLAQSLTGFVPVSVVADAALPEPAVVPEAAEQAPISIGMIEVELPTGVRLRITGDVGEAALRRVLAAFS
ncbi:transposase [Nitrospirillum amazonense]|uniref:transposase n=1 Tax=Nitrospirillum amazonense TaxID=28077 RepID=UPI002412B00E|nr:transposase [Nitrospirillum amazonense]MDG3439268.1 transposase [Nitrospirillum amazonense]